MMLGEQADMERDWKQIAVEMRWTSGAQSALAYIPLPSPTLASPVWSKHYSYQPLTHTLWPG